MNEEAAAAEDEVWTEYARTKRLAEIEVRRLAAGGAPVVTLFPGVIFGPGKLTAGNLIVDWIVRFCRGKFPGFLGKGAERWCFAYVSDVAKGHLLADERGENGRGYCLGGENVSIRKFMTTVAEITGREPPKRCVPFGVAKCVGLLQEWRAFLTGREPELTRGIVDTFRNYWALDSSRAKNELGYEPTPLHDAIEQTLTWLREEKYID
jgi:farnesol dehydrogenase